MITTRKRDEEPLPVVELVVVVVDALRNERVFMRCFRKRAYPGLGT
jgi:hypothetical protein